MNEIKMVEVYRSLLSDIGYLEKVIDHHIRLAEDHDSVRPTFFRGTYSNTGIDQLEKKYREAGWETLTIRPVKGGKSPDGVEVNFR